MLKKHKWLILISLLIILIALVMIVLSLLPGKQPGYSILAEMFGVQAPSVSVSQLYFEVGRNRSFAHSYGYVASAGTLGFQVLGPDGTEALGESFRLSVPALVENNGRFLVFDIGGSSLRVFDKQNILSSVETEGYIISASINKNGWYCIVTGEQLGGSRAAVDVYDNKGTHVFRVTVGSYFVICAKLSDNNENLALLGVSQSGSLISIYSGINTDKDAPDYVYETGTNLLIDIDYLTESKILAIGEESVLTADFSENASTAQLYGYADKKLGGYTRTGNFLALHLYDYGIGYSGHIIAISFDGTVLGEIDSFPEIISMDSFEDTLILLCSDGILFYDKHLESFAFSDGNISASTAGTVLALTEDTALAANDLSAVVVRSEIVN